MLELSWSLCAETAGAAVGESKGPIMECRWRSHCQHKDIKQCDLWEMW